MTMKITHSECFYNWLLKPNNPLSQTGIFHCLKGCMVQEGKFGATAHRYLMIDRNMEAL
jgi:hypothetical protein